MRAIQRRDVFAAMKYFETLYRIPKPGRNNFESLLLVLAAAARKNIFRPLYLLASVTLAPGDGIAV